jgi:hypothetical protein
LVIALRQSHESFIPEQFRITIERTRFEIDDDLFQGLSAPLVFHHGQIHFAFTSLLSKKTENKNCFHRRDAETRRKALIHKDFSVFLTVLVLDSKSDQRKGLSLWDEAIPVPNTCFSEIGQVIS